MRPSTPPLWNLPWNPSMWVPRVPPFQVLAKWTRSQPIRTTGEIRLHFSLLETRPAFAYQRIADEAIRLHRLGIATVAIAKTLGVTDKTVAKAIHWSRSTRGSGA
jgi:hypothetical protein